MLAYERLERGREIAPRASMRLSASASVRPAGGVSALPMR
jgi:hypothetical protein